VSLRSLVTIVAAAGALLGVGAVLQQQAQLESLRSETRRLRTALESPTPRSLPQPAPDATAARLSDAEKSELMRLRAAVAQLLQRQRELSAVREENVRLRARLAAGGAGGVEGVPAPPGWIRRRDARFAGLSTPEASLESLFWVIEHEDTNRLFAMHTGSSLETLQRMLDQEGAKGLWEQFRMVPGFRIVGSEARSDHEVVLRVEVAPGLPATDMKLLRVGAEWKLSL